MKHFLLSSLLLLANGLSAQTTVELSATRDNTIYSESNETSNGSGSYIFTGATSGSNIRRALLYFDVSSIPANAPITAVTLSLTCSKAGIGSSGIGVYKLNNNWGEGNSDANNNEGSGAPALANDATWTSRFFNTPSLWALDGGDFSNVISVSQASVSNGASLNLSSAQLIADVQSWVSNPDGNFGWILRGNENVSGSARRYNSRQNPTNPPKLTITYGPLLPLHLVTFSAKQVKEGFQLNWETDREEKFSHFIIEHSTNGSMFNAIARIPSNPGHPYRYQDTRPLSDKNFYRLSMVDLDGTTRYSSIVQAQVIGAHSISIWPNPASGILNISYAGANEKISYRLIDVNGRVVQKNGLSARQINISGLNDGLYYLELTGENGLIKREPFIKQR